MNGVEQIESVPHLPQGRWLAIAPAAGAVAVLMAVAGWAYWNSGRAEREVTETVKHSLRDPGSATFRNLTGGCGEVNAKNAFGALAGFEPFYVRVTPGSAPELFIGQDAKTTISIECSYLLTR